MKLAQGFITVFKSGLLKNCSLYDSFEQFYYRILETILH